MTSLQTSLESALRNALQSALEHSALKDNLTAGEQQDILGAVLYPLDAGGKRVRPALTCLIAEACGAGPEHPALLQCAAAVECIHTYSLVHDDLPCMDNDDVRRGKPTTHKIFGEAKALLVGDALLTHAFHLLSRAHESGLPAMSTVHCVEILSRCAGPFGMIAGQWKDLTHTDNRTSADWQTLCAIHNLKTGALLGAACALGVVVGTSLGKTQNNNDLGELTRSAEQLGLTIGLAFQIVDDILDVTQNSQELGKTAGKDEIQDKLTAVSVLGIEGARAEADRLTHAALAHLQALRQRLPPQLPGAPNASAWQRLERFIRQLLDRTS